MWGLPFCFLICSFLYLFTCFIYLFLPFFIFYFCALSLCHSFYFFSIFLEPEPKLFHVAWVYKWHWHLIFSWSVMGNQNNIVKFGVPEFFWLFRCSGVLWGVPGCSGVPWGVPECSRVFRCSCVPVFLVLLHVILLTIFENAWQNPVRGSWRGKMGAGICLF